MSKNTLLLGLVWIGLAGFIYYLADQTLHPNKAESLGEGHSVSLKRGTDGHYRAEALINGEKVDVLDDTGATGVAISQRLARQLKLTSHNAITTYTANGETVSYMTRLQEVKLGGVAAHDVAAIIAPGLAGDALLGMSFLGRMDVRLFQDTMTIKQADAN